MNFFRTRARIRLKPYSIWAVDIKPWWSPFWWFEVDYFDTRKEAIEVAVIYTSPQIMEITCK